VRLSLRLLEPSDDLSTFTCGEDAIDRWAHTMAHAAHSGGSARVYVAVTPEDRVIGFYTLSTASVARSDVTRRVGQGMPDPVPVLLLGRMGVTAEWQGRGVGVSLLQDAIKRTLAAASSVGIRAMLVHALNDPLVTFYRRFGFESSPVGPRHLLLLLKDAKKTLTELS